MLNNFKFFFSGTLRRVGKKEMKNSLIEKIVTNYEI